MCTTTNGCLISYQLVVLLERWTMMSTVMQQQVSLEDRVLALVRQLEDSAKKQAMLAKKLNKLTKTIEKHAKTLDKHGKTLEKHAKTLEVHGKALQEHQEVAVAFHYDQAVMTACQAWEIITQIKPEEERKTADRHFQPDSLPLVWESLRVMLSAEDVKRGNDMVAMQQENRMNMLREQRNTIAHSDPLPEHVMKALIFIDGLELDYIKRNKNGRLWVLDSGNAAKLDDLRWCARFLRVFKALRSV